MHKIHGGCHCGNLSVEVGLSAEPASYQPRACDCAYCRQHGAAWLSDATGSLAISVAHSQELGIYRQGSEQAELLFCRRCGGLTAVLLQAGGRTFGAVNSKAFVATSVTFGAEICVSPQKLAPGDKVTRWRELWFANVSLTTPA
jgi:hypothetical protein